MPHPSERLTIVQVPTDAPTGEIKRAYMKLAMKMHPDKNQDDPEATAKFQKLGEAYQVRSHLSPNSTVQTLGDAYPVRRSASYACQIRSTRENSYLSLHAAQTQQQPAKPPLSPWRGGQVLSHEESRARYDAKGMEGLDDHKFMDPSTMYAMLFGCARQARPLTIYGRHTADRHGPYDIRQVRDALRL